MSPNEKRVFAENLKAAANTFLNARRVLTGETIEETA
jgi:hypothetical protein